MLNQIVMWPALLFNWARDKCPRRDDRGASLVEYALLLALISVVAIGALVFLGHAVNNTLNQVGNAINSTDSTS